MTTEPLMKLVLSGLANAGKTSILRILQHNYRIGESLPPTKGVERTKFSLFGLSGAIWDFGGQSQYMDEYLKNPQRFFSDLQHLFFIIDMQDSLQFESSLQYFKEIYTHALELNQNFILSVLFHKLDPPLSEFPEYRQRINLVTSKIRAIVAEGEFGLYETSTYNPLSIVHAFSHPILGDQPLYNTLSQYFADFCINRGIEYMSLVIDGLFEIGSFRLQTARQDFLNATVKFYEEFAELESNSPINYYELEGYRFEIIRRPMNSYKCTLSYAYPIEILAETIAEVDRNQLLQFIDEQFHVYQPKLY